jgi:uncharacterized protein YprB with RNaseH-like and TPR domain
MSTKMVKKVFFDTEFTGLHQNTTLILLVITLATWTLLDITTAVEHQDSFM